MKTALLAAALVAASFQAFAADMPVKAPLLQRAPLFYGGSGVYCGGGPGGEATKLGAATGTASAVYEAGALMNIGCGYTFAMAPDRFAFVQGNFAYSHADAKMPCGAGLVCSVDNKQSFDLKVGYGAPMSVLSGIFSNATAAFGALPPIPVGAINSTAHPYIAVGARVSRDTAFIDALVTERKTRVNGIFGVGIMYQTNTATVIDTFADWTFGSGRFLITPGTDIKLGSTFRMGARVNWSVTDRLSGL